MVTMPLLQPMPMAPLVRNDELLDELLDVVTSPPAVLARRLSALIGRCVPHTALVIATADTSGVRRQGVGDETFVEGVSFLELDRLRIGVAPGRVRRSDLSDGVGTRPTLQALSRNGALLLLAEPGDADAAGSDGGADVEDGGGRADADADHAADELVLRIWNHVALRAQSLADAAPPDYLHQARATSGVRMEALTELTDEYSTTLESVLAALRSASLDDRASRQTATALAAEGLVHLRTATDRVRTFTEEPVTTAFERLRDDLRPLMRYRDIEVQFIEPPVDGRPLPSEVAHGARAVVRGSILTLVDAPGVRRVRVQWDCDGRNLLIDMRDDGPGDLPEASSLLQLVRQRVKALDGTLSVEATPGWGIEMAIVIPLDPPRAAPEHVTAWDLRPRELDVLELLVGGRRNKAIADELGISINTVKFHISRILRKLDVGSRAEVVAKVGAIGFSR